MKKWSGFSEADDKPDKRFPLLSVYHIGNKINPSSKALQLYKEISRITLRRMFKYITKKSPLHNEEISASCRGKNKQMPRFREILFNLFIINIFSFIIRNNLFSGWRSCVVLTSLLPWRGGGRFMMLRFMLLLCIPTSKNEISYHSQYGKSHKES